MQYTSPFSKFYDLFYSGKNYREEVVFIKDKLNNADKNIEILEMACGTGSHALEFEKLGFKNIIAFDLSESQIKRALEKKHENNSSIDFRIDDMCTFNYGTEIFSYVFCFFDSIGFVQTNSNLDKVFQNVYKSLKKNGIFVFEFWHSSAMVKGFDAIRTRHFKTEQATIERISETKLDIPKQLAHVTYTIKVTDENGLIEHTETQTNRYFSIPEINYMLEKNGLIAESFFNGFTSSETIDENSWHIVCFARKK